METQELRCNEGWGFDTRQRRLDEEKVFDELRRELRGLEISNSIAEDFLAKQQVHLRNFSGNSSFVSTFNVPEGQLSQFLKQQVRGSTWSRFFGLSWRRPTSENTLFGLCSSALVLQQEQFLVADISLGR